MHIIYYYQFIVILQTMRNILRQVIFRQLHCMKF